MKKVMILLIFCFISYCFIGCSKKVDKKAMRMILLEQTEMSFEVISGNITLKQVADSIGIISDTDIDILFGDKGDNEFFDVIVFTDFKKNLEQGYWGDYRFKKLSTGQLIIYDLEFTKESQAPFIDCIVVNKRIVVNGIAFIRFKQLEGDSWKGFVSWVKSIGGNEKDTESVLKDQHYALSNIGG